MWAGDMSQALHKACVHHICAHTMKNQPAGPATKVCRLKHSFAHNRTAVQLVTQLLPHQKRLVHPLTHRSYDPCLQKSCALSAVHVCNYTKSLTWYICTTASLMLCRVTLPS